MITCRILCSVSLLPPVLFALQGSHVWHKTHSECVVSVCVNVVTNYQQAPVQPVALYNTTKSPRFPTLPQEGVHVSACVGVRPCLSHHVPLIPAGAFSKAHGRSGSKTQNTPEVFSSHQTWMDTRRTRALAAFLLALAFVFFCSREAAGWLSAQDPPH